MSDTVIPAAFLFLLKIALAIWDLLCFQMDFTIDFCFSMKNNIGILVGNLYIFSVV
jgi:hypothetical protein